MAIYPWEAVKQLQSLWISLIASITQVVRKPLLI